MLEFIEEEKGQTKRSGLSFLFTTHEKVLNCVRGASKKFSSFLSKMVGPIIVIFTVVVVVIMAASVHLFLLCSVGLPAPHYRASLRIICVRHSVNCQYH